MYNPLISPEGDLTGAMPSGYESVTKTTESGAFIRTTIRKGKKRRQKTKRIKKSDKKVVLGYIGEFEVYVYPYDFPDTVFVGKFPISTQLESGDERKLTGVTNKIRAYFRGDYFSEPKRSKGANARRRTIQRAYNQGLKEKTGAKKP